MNRTNVHNLVCFSDAPVRFSLWLGSGPLAPNLHDLAETMFPADFLVVGRGKKSLDLVQRGCQREGILIKLSTLVDIGNLVSDLPYIKMNVGVFRQIVRLNFKEHRLRRM